MHTTFRELGTCSTFRFGRWPERGLFRKLDDTHFVDDRTGDTRFIHDLDQPVERSE